MPTYTNPTGMVDATTGDDVIIFNAPWQSGTTVNALGGNDDLLVQIDSDSPIKIDATDEFNAGYFNLDIRFSPFSPLYVFNVENLELHGTVHADTFGLRIGPNSSALSANMSGGDGQDLLVFNWVALTTGMTFVVNGANITSSFGTFTSFEIFHIHAGSGNDTITTGGGDDLVYTGSGLDNVSTGGGSDSIVLDSTDGTVDAGDGDDFVTVNSTPGSDINLDGGAGQDTLRLNWAGASVAINFAIDGTNISSNFGSFANFETFSIRLGSGDDTVATGSGDDEVWGGNGNNTISSGGGDDYLLGGSGIDLLDGGEGDDELWGFEGNDHLLGGDGNDLIYGHQGNDHLDGGDGADTIYGDNFAEVPGDGDDTINGGLGNDTIHGGFGNDYITGGADADQIHGGQGEDYLDGGDGDDHLVGYDDTAGIDTILGGAGNDIIAAGFGDSVDGGAGTDQLHISYYAGASSGITADFRVLTSGGTLSIAGATLTGIEYVGSISLTDFDDVVIAGAVDGVMGVGLSGWGGNDVLTGSSGVDTIWGGDGNDVIYGGIGFNPNIIPSTDRLRGEAGDDTIHIGSDGAEASGGVGNDTIYGGEASDAIFGDEGNDLLYGGGGNDGINGGDGDDYIDGGTGADAMAGYDGDDTYIVDDVGDTIYETGGFNTALASVSYTMALGVNVLTLTGGADLVGTGNFLNNTINGNSGQNILYGLGGNDILNGGDGDDTLSGGAGNDMLDGGAGNDTVSYADAAAGVTVILGLIGAQDTFGAGTDTLSGFEILVGSQYGDRLTAGAGYLILFGGSGNDTLVSSADGDRLYGEAGDDTFIGGAGNDEFVGGDGFDTVDYSSASGGVAAGFTVGGANGVDQLSGIEKIIGSNFDDRLSSAGVLQGGAGNDVYSASSSTQVVEAAGQGFDRVEAWNTHYILPENVEGLSLHFDPYAGATIAPHPATLNGTGNSLDNVITGSNGSNQLSGLAGSDTLTGGSGIDILTGGTGSDTFRDTASGLNGDTITDFSTGDRIVISDVSLASFNFSLSGSTLTFTGGSLTLTGFTGQLKASAAAGGGVQLTVVSDASNDFNGDGRSDVLWHHDTGRVINWLGQANGGFASNIGNFDGHVGTDWSVAETGDFNGDGRDDVLWRSDSGAVTNWLGQTNGGFASNFANAYGEMNVSWSIAGTGDFNGDGRDDVLWHHSSGRVTNWLSQASGGFASNVANFDGQVGTNWHIVGTGDFNGDGRDDVLWRSDSGEVTNWLGQANGGFASNFANAYGVFDTGWHVAGTGDFDGDGRDDVLWHHSSGRVTNWLGQANGGFAGNFAHADAQAGTDWDIAGVGDYNGDGRDDILWRNDNGAVTNWLGQANGSFASNFGNAYGEVDNSWHIRPASEGLI